jgi:acyl-[acyl-carrier-protein]-phospholipid O-acyltransferase / long-chain-fatty-acid--[acyl-carrier-protein] ligase
MVGIFAEGAITRTGNLLPFKSGLERIVAGTDVPIVPVHLDRLWGSIFSFERGKFFWKWPKRIPYPVTVSFGRPAALDGHRAGSAAGDSGTGQRGGGSAQIAPGHIGRAVRSLGAGELGEIRHGGFHRARTDLRRTLIGSLLIAEWVRKNRREEEMVGVLLPASVAGAVTNVGVTMAGRVPVNLNFTAGAEAMAAVSAQCRIRTVITSRAFLAKAKLDAMEGAVYVEDILGGASGATKAAAWMRARLMPAGLLLRRYAKRAQTPDSLATVVFSSGSTGVPKGVMLSHYNLISDIEAMLQVFSLAARIASWACCRSSTRSASRSPSGCRC